MMIYPDVQKRGQAELDSVIGRERLPTFDDRPRLPFVDAVYKEVLRWHPVAPVGVFPRSLPMTWRYLSSITSSLSSLVGVPHAATKDDIYAGFFIPKGESRFPNEICLMFVDSYIPHAQARWS